MQDEILTTEKSGIVVIRDKNHLNKSLPKVIHNIRSFFVNKQAKIILGVPCVKDNVVERISPEMILNCLYNIKHRDQHLLNYQGVHTLEILKDFAKDVKNIQLNDLKIDGCVQYFTQRTPHNKQIEEKLAKMVHNNMEKANQKQKKEFKSLFDQLTYEDYEDSDHTAQSLDEIFSAPPT